MGGGKEGGVEMEKERERERERESGGGGRKGRGRYQVNDIEGRQPELSTLDQARNEPERSLMLAHSVKALSQLVMNRVCV